MTHPIRGPKGASVVLIEYADFQCPYCRDAESVLRKVLEAYSQDVCLVFKHFPLVDIHEWAVLAALAAEAAGQQGYFWEMHDQLFEHQETLGLESILQLAQTLGLDRKRFSRDLHSEVCRSRVEQDLQSAEKLGLEGTPSLLVNDEAFHGPLDFNSLSRAVAGYLGERAA